jgi:ketosteroid isomerase-like protein
MKANAQTEAEINAVLGELAEGYRVREMRRALACFAPDDDVVMYGTGVDEKRVGRREIQLQVERDWEQTESTELTYEWVSVSGVDRVAWAAADATFRIRAGGEAMALPARITLVLEKRGGTWFIVQGHFSLPAAGQEEGTSF